MNTPGRWSGRRWTAVPLIGSCLAVLVAGTVALLAPATPAVAATGDVTVSGHGYGHGRGMGQYGALGYAVDAGWSAEAILDHYYGGSVAANDAGNPVLTVELTAWRGKGLIVTAPGLAVDGARVGAGAVLVSRVGADAFQVYSGPGCAGPWTAWGGAVPGGLIVKSVADFRDPANHLQTCESSQVRGYRGELQVVDTGTTSALVNRLPVDEYLSGVVPRESAASWADLGGGRGLQALRAQAVAARSYALSSNYAAYARACDTTTCQVYSGEFTRPFSSATRISLEDQRSNLAVTGTTGTVRRMPNGAVARTEFSASTGGWTAGGTFAAVKDLGDAYSGNPYRSWSVTVGRGELSADLGVTGVTGLRVTQRNGLGAESGRVLTVVVDTARGPVTFTGDQFRSRLGLRSDWFSLSTTSADEAQAFTRAVYVDLLGREPSGAELSGRAAEAAFGRPRNEVTRDIAGSDERVGHLVDEAFTAALGRLPAAAERSGWTAAFRTTGNLVDLRVGVFGSPEAFLRAGSNQRAWVTNLYRTVLLRNPSGDERAGWAAAADRDGRASVARSVSLSNEACVRRLDGYYSSMLGRQADLGAVGFLTELQTSGDISVPAGISASPEYLARALARYPG